MSSSEDFPAKMCLAPDAAPALPASVQDSTGNWCVPFAWFDRDTQSWRTWQCCLVTGWELFSETWPRAGLMLNGIAYRRAPSAPLTNEIGSGLLPTPQARDHFPPHTQEYIAAKKAQGHGMANLNDFLAHNMLPTPIANDAEKRGDFNIDRSVCLPGELRRHLLPTPRASDADKGGRGDLLTVLRGYETKHAGTLPTPTARDYRSGKSSEATHERNSRPLNETLAKMADNRSGRMSPRFREWMMSFPIGWTELEPQVTRSSRRSRS